MFKKLILLSLALAVILGCQLSGTETQAPAEPPPTEMAIAEPPATSVSQSGDLLYETTFDDIDNWQIDTMENKAEYVNESRSDGLYVKVPDKDDYWFAYYNLRGGTNDVRIETDAELVADNDYTYISLICRSSEKGEYIFDLDTGGFWQIGRFDFDTGDYEQLGYGDSEHIKVAKDTNHIAVTCEGNELTMLINNHKVGSAQDTQYTDGEIGIGVETFDAPLAEVVFHNLRVYVP